MFFSVALMSVSLSLDALFAGLAYGLEGTRVPLGSKFMICLFSCLYAGVTILAGRAVLRFIPPAVGRFSGAAILAAIGLSMIVRANLRQARSGKGGARSGAQHSEEKTLFRLIIKSLGITIQILKNPDAGDMDRSGIIDMRESVLLGSALSIDALGVGLGTAISGLTGLYIPLAIGLCQLLFLSTGLFAGRRFGRRFEGRLAQMLPGLLLLGLSALRLI